MSLSGYNEFEPKLDRPLACKICLDNDCNTCDCFILWIQKLICGYNRELEASSTTLSELNQLCLIFLLETIECDSAIIGPIENYSMVKLLQSFHSDIGHKWKLLHRGSVDGFDRDLFLTKFKDKLNR